jgi:pyridoxine kinase
MTKRILTIQDYSCLGRCSLTVALPIISTSGIECVGIPTAVLSNHTAFPSWTYADLTKEITKTADKWDGFNTKFDALYTGYLGKGQEDIIASVIRKFKRDDNLYLMDPAFGTHGHLYPGFDDEHVEKMKDLLPIADIITPNLTEACALLHKKYPKTYTKRFINNLAKKLAELGPRYVVISGLTFQPGKIACMGYDKVADKIYYYETDLLLDGVHGAGDCFASVVISSLVLGLSLKYAIRMAHDFVHAALKHNMEENVNPRLYGPIFEPELGNLKKNIEKTLKKIQA